MTKKLVIKKSLSYNNPNKKIGTSNIVAFKFSSKKLQDYKLLL